MAWRGVGNKILFVQDPGARSVHEFVSGFTSATFSFELLQSCFNCPCTFVCV